MVMFPRDSPRHETSVQSTPGLLDKHRMELLRNEWHSWQTNDDVGSLKLFVIHGAEEGPIGVRTSLDWHTTYWGYNIPNLPGLWFIACHLPTGNIEFKAVRGDEDVAIWEGPPNQNKHVDLSDEAQVISGEWGTSMVDAMCEGSSMFPMSGMGQLDSRWATLPEAERAVLMQADDEMTPLRLFVIQGELEGGVGVRTSLDWDSTHWGYHIPALPELWFIPCHLPSGSVEFKVVQGNQDNVVWEQPPNQNKLVNLGDETQIICGQWGTNTVDMTVDIPSYENDNCTEDPVQLVIESMLDSVASCDSPMANIPDERSSPFHDREAELPSEPTSALDASYNETTEQSEEEDEKCVSGLLSELHQLLHSLEDFPACISKSLLTSIRVLRQDLSKHMNDSEPKMNSSATEIVPVGNGKLRHTFNGPDQSPITDTTPKRMGDHGEDAPAKTSLDKNGTVERLSPDEQLLYKSGPTTYVNGDDDSVLNVEGDEIYCPNPGTCVLDGVSGCGHVGREDLDQSYTTCSGRSVDSADTASVISTTAGRLNISLEDDGLSFQTSTPHKPRRSTRHNTPGEKRKSGAKRTKNMRIGSKSDKTSCDINPAYRPRIWNILFNVFGWYSRPKLDEIKASLNTSVD